MRRAIFWLLLAAGCNRAGVEGTPPLTLTLPQAVDGALWVNPATYAAVPLRIGVSGEARAVWAELQGARVDAVREDGGWVATLPVSALEDGERALTVHAEGGGQAAHLEARLGVGRAGVQLTDFFAVGSARSPRLHRFADGVWVTWTDRSEGRSKAWLRRIDGAGRWTGDRVLLVEAADEVHYARVAVGDRAIGVLYQRPGVPYKSFFTMVGFDGKPLMQPVAIEPEGWDATWGGDVAYDRGAFVAVSRSQGPGPSELKWLRVEEASARVTGPVVIARSGAGTAADPAGRFSSGFMFMKVQAAGDTSVVSFVRERYLPILDLAIPKGELALVRPDGAVTLSPVGDPGDFFFHREARVYRVGDELVPLWTARDLQHPDENAPQIVFGARQMPPVEGARVIDAADDRDEPFLMPHSRHFGVLAWLDHREYATDLLHGKIRLHVAPVSAALEAGAETVFEHPRFVAGTSDLNAIAAGTNALLSWVDERHGGGVADPKPELYFETAWF